MATSYDKPVQQQVQSTYIPLPFEEMMGQAKYLQGNFEKAEEAMTKGGDFLSTVDALGPAAKAEVQAVIDPYNTYVDKSANLDLTDAMVVKDINKKVRELSTNPTIKKALADKAAYEETQKMHNQARATDINYRDYYEQDFAKAKEAYNQMGTKAPVDFSTLTPGKYINLKEDLEKKYFDEITADAVTGEKGTVTVANKGITYSKIFNQADSSMQSYMQHPQVQKEMDYQLANTPPEQVIGDYKMNLGKVYAEGGMTKEAFDKQVATLDEGLKSKNIDLKSLWAKNRLLNTGFEKVFNETSQVTNQKGIAALADYYKRQEEGRKQEAPTTTRVGSTMNKAISRTIFNSATNDPNLNVQKEVFVDGVNRGKRRVTSTAGISTAEKIDLVTTSFMIPTDDGKSLKAAGNFYVPTSADRKSHQKLNSSDIVEVEPSNSNIYMWSRKQNMPTDLNDASVDDFSVEGTVNAYVTEKGARKIAEAKVILGGGDPNSGSGQKTVTNLLNEMKEKGKMRVSESNKITFEPDTGTSTSSATTNQTTTAEQLYYAENITANNKVNTHQITANERYFQTKGARDKDNQQIRYGGQ